MGNHPLLDQLFAVAVGKLHGSGESGHAAVIDDADPSAIPAQGGKAYKILSIRPQGQMALLQLEGVSDMDAARALRGQVFYFDRNDATLPAGRWYVADLIGCEVRDADTGKVYGVVTSVDHPGAQDIYTVKAPGGKEYMFPGVDAFLKERNPPEGYILVTPIPGLLDDDFDSEREEE